MLVFIRPIEVIIIASDANIELSNIKNDKAKVFYLYGLSPQTSVTLMVYNVVVRSSRNCPVTNRLLIMHLNGH